MAKSMFFFIFALVKINQEHSLKLIKVYGCKRNEEKT